MDEFKPEVPKSEKPYNKYEGEVLYSGAPSDQESTDPLSIDKGHGDRGSLNVDQESAAKSPDVKHSIFDVLRKKKVSIPIIGTVATAAAAAAIYVGVSRLGSDNSSRQGNQPVAAAPATPGATTSPETTQSPDASAKATPPAEVEMTSKEINRLESYAPAMEKYKNMDISTFEALPRSERLLYAQYLMDNSVAREEYSSRYGKYAVKNQQELAITPVPVSLENTGQEIVDGWLLRLQISYVQNNGSSSIFDVTPGREALSAAYYNVGESGVADEYNAAINMQATLDKPTPIGNKNTVTDTSELLSGKNSQSETVKYKIVTFLTQDNQPLYATFVFDKFKRYDGPEETIWLKEAQSEVSVNDLKKLSSIK